MFLKLSNISSIVTKKKVKPHSSHRALYSSEVTKDQVEVILRLLVLNDPEGDTNVIKSYGKFNCFAKDLFLKHIYMWKQKENQHCSPF